MKWTVAAILAGGVLSGCSIAELEALPGKDATVNQCRADDECGEGICLAGICRGRAGRFSSVLLEILPNTTADGAALRQLTTVKGLVAQGGALDLELADPAEVEVSVAFQAPYDCTFGAGSVPFVAVFTPSAQVLGLESRSIAVTGTETARTSLMPGDYDVYVAPASPSDPTTVGPGLGCPLVPQLHRNQRFESGRVQLVLDAGAPRVLQVAVHVDRMPAVALDGWTVDLLDASSGVLLSAPARLQRVDGVTHRAELAYHPPLGQGNAAEGMELVRLVPPTGVAAPSLIWERAALELFTAGQATIEGLSALPAPVRFSARVVDEADVPVEGALVTLVSTEVLGLPAGVLASYSLKHQPTDANGELEVELLPGNYRVFAVPPGTSSLAAVEGSWSVSTVPFQAGQALTLPPRVPVSGTVEVPWGAGAVSGATVHALVAPAETQAGALDAALGRRAFVPRTHEAVVEGGRFELSADPATYDVSVRPKEGSGLPWAVRPNVTVRADAHAVDLGSLDLSLPIVYEGSLLGAASTADALLRAYIYLDRERRPTPDPERARSVVQVAETRTDAAGRFRLLLPSGLD